MLCLIALLFGAPAFAEAPAAPESSEQHTAPLGEPTPAPTQHVSATLTLAVAQREASAQTLLDAAEDMGGWFAGLSETHVDLRVPASQLDALINLAAAEGTVLDRGYSSEDLGAQLTDTRARLAARQKVLTEYLALLPKASPKSVVTVERETVALVAEIEVLQGRLRVLEHRVQWGELRVDFRFRDRAAPRRDGSSNFAWLNTLNVADLLDDLRYGVPSRATKRVGLGPLQVEGFSPYRRVRRERRATSPDQVVVRVRAEEHEPEADAAFWQEATIERMEAAGYTLLRKSEVEIAGQAGFLLEWTAPLGASDYGYLVAVVPSGGRLYVVEAAGEISRYEARRDAILAAVMQLDL